MKKTDKSFEFDYEEVKNKALAQLKTGKPLLGKDGALAPLFKSFLEAALEAWKIHALCSPFPRLLNPPSPIFNEPSLPNQIDPQEVLNFI